MDNLRTILNYERVVLDNLPLVDAIVRSIARRHRLSADEAKELAATVRLKLVDRNYEVLRRFKNESSLRTYLTTVVNRHFLDQRIAAWGKWRPCMFARRLGPHAVLLDQLLTRDGISLDEAIGRIERSHGVARSELEEIAAQLKPRAMRRVTSDEGISELADLSGEQALLDALDRPANSTMIDSALNAALSQLEPQDRLVLKLRFCDGCTVARIAELLGIDQKGLYRRLASVLQVLRRELERQGVNAAQVAALIGDPATELSPAIVTATQGIDGRGPSV